MNALWCGGYPPHIKLFFHNSKFYIFFILVFWNNEIKKIVEKCHFIYRCVVVKNIIQKNIINKINAICFVVVFLNAKVLATTIMQLFNFKSLVRFFYISWMLLCCCLCMLLYTYLISPINKRW